MKHLSVDIETYSSVSIGDCGVYKYTESEDFEILLFAYSEDFGDPKVIDLAQGELLPIEIQLALFDGDVVKHAFNAAFEWVCLSRYFNLDRVAQLNWAKQWRCTMVHAYYLGYAGNLDMVGKAVGLAEDKQKLATGKALIRYFSCPVKPTKANGGRTRNLPHHDPDKWALYKEYNRMDVVAETNIYMKLKGIPVPDFIWEQWVTDLTINSRGVPVDTELVYGALAINDEIRAEYMSDFRALTGLENPASNTQLLSWVKEHGCDLPNMQKATISDALKGELPDGVRAALQYKQEVSKTSVKKYDKVLDYICADGRVRGILQFYGASTTGRYSGRGIQLQNLPRTYLTDIDSTRTLVKQRNTTALEMFYSSVSDTLSQLIRTAFIPSEGGVLLDADFSAIEARVIGWLANEEWVLEEFRGAGKIYEATASQMFGVPKEQIKKGTTLYKLRQQGKVAQLACIAENQLVLTDKGLIPIQNITTDMLLWDGESWVSHEGVIYKGVKKVYEYEGLVATEDHVVWVTECAKPIPFKTAAESGAHLVQSGAGGQAIWISENNIAGTSIHKGLGRSIRSGGMSNLQGQALGRADKSNEWEVERLFPVLKNEDNSCMVAKTIDCGKATLRKPKGCRLPKIRRTRNTIRVRDSNRGMYISGRKLRRPKSKYGIRSYRLKWKLCSGESKIRDKSSKRGKQTQYGIVRLPSRILALRSIYSGQKVIGRHDTRRDHRRCAKSSRGEKKKLARYKGEVKVYDIRNAGKHNRFTVSGKLVHNCSYGGGVAALTAMDFNHEIPDDIKPGLVSQWRDANPRIVQLWYALEKACIDTVKSGTPHIINGKLKTELVSSGGITYLRIVLPNSRAIYYCEPHMVTNRFGKESIGFYGKNQITNKWTETETYGGKLAENVTQAVARDLLAESIERLEAAGFEILFHIHDEVVIDYRGPDADRALKKVYGIMSTTPSWAEGLPMAADGWWGHYFKKD